MDLIKSGNLCVCLSSKTENLKLSSLIETLYTGNIGYDGAKHFKMRHRMILSLDPTISLNYSFNLQLYILYKPMQLRPVRFACYSL